MLVMSLLILAINLLQDIMNLLLEVLDLFNNFSWYVCLGLSMGGLCRGRWNKQSYINGGQRLEPQAYLKRAMANGSMKGSVIAMLNIWKALIPCTWMLGVVHPHDMHNPFVDHLCFSICLGMEGS
jgi:hypothetical protein